MDFSSDSKWHDGRVWFGRKFHIEWKLGRKANGLKFSYQQNTYNPDIVIHIAIKWLFSVFFVFGDVAMDRQPREYGIRIHDWLFTIHYGDNPDEWSKDSKRKSFFIDDLLFGHANVEIIADELNRMEITLPEGVYPLMVTRTVNRRTRRRVPLYREIFVIYDIESETGVPIPGKGESSWDLDDDAIFSAGYWADSYDEALDRFKQYVLDRRLKYGGPNWLPEKAS